jgi:hypothetical protein
MEMNALFLTLAMLAHGGASPRASVEALPNCPAATAQSDRLAYGLATSADYSDLRSRWYLQATTPENVRVLADPGDSASCQKMHAHALQVAQSHGGSLDGTTTVFYKAGLYYFAIVTIPPDLTTPPPGAVRIRHRFVPLYVFDGNLNPITALAM